jgi:tetratricopeptide (TPR) repeat protein
MACVIELPLVVNNPDRAVLFLPLDHKDASVMATKNRKGKPIPKRPKGLVNSGLGVNSQKAFRHALAAFYEDDDSELALELMRDLEAQGPLTADMLGFYFMLLDGAKLPAESARVAMQIAERCPSDAEANQVAGANALLAMMPANSIFFFERFVKLAPDHAGAEAARERVEEVRRIMPKIMDREELDVDAELPRLVSGERVQLLLEMGRAEEAVKRAESHLKSYPNDSPIRNDYAELLIMHCDHERAIKVLDRTLEIEPDNAFAIAVRCRVLTILGRLDEALVESEKLTSSIEFCRASQLMKAAQAFIYLGQESKVAWAYHEAVRKGMFNEPGLATDTIKNWYATSLARAGNFDEARRLWKQVRNATADADTASINLEEAKRPANIRSGPAYFSLVHFLTKTQFEDYQKTISQAVRFASLVEDGEEDDGDVFQHNESNEIIADAMEQWVRLFFLKHPGIARMIPSMLEHGDLPSQDLAIGIAEGYPTAAVKEALVKYVTGSHGSHAIRRKALGLLEDAGHPFDGAISMKIGGSLKEIAVRKLEISYEPNEATALNGRSESLLQDALDALQRGEPQQAVGLISELRQREGDQSTVLFNLAEAYLGMERYDEADAMIDEIVANDPGYFFGKLGIVLRHIRKQEYAAAKELLTPLQNLQKFDIWEFVCMASASIMVSIGMREIESAKAWLALLEDHQSDNPNIEMFEEMIENAQAKPGGLLSRLWSKF